MKKIHLLILILILLISIISKLHASDFPFVLNRSNQYYYEPYYELTFSYNNLKSLSLLGPEADMWDPLIHPEKYIYSSNVKYGTERFLCELNYYLINHPNDGLIIETSSTGGDSIAGYDINQAKNRIIDGSYLTLQLLLTQNRLYDLSVSIDLKPGTSLLVFFHSWFVSKKFNRFSYSSGMEFLSYYFLPKPIEFFFSISYSPFNFASVFFENKFLIEDPKTFVFVTGVNFEINKNIQLSFFYHHFQDNPYFPVYYKTTDQRFGFEIKLSNY